MPSISVEVDTYQFGTRDLIDELFNRATISRKERDALLARKDRTPREGAENAFEFVDKEAVALAERARLVEEAAWRSRRKDFADSIVCITRAFPELSGLQALVGQP